MTRLTRAIACIPFLACFTAAPAWCQVAYYALEGDLNAVGAQHDFFFDLSRSVSSPEVFQFETYANAGGLNFAEIFVASGGIDGFLELFTAAGVSRGSNDNGALRDGPSGEMGDAILSWPGLGLARDGGPITVNPVAAGSYRLNSRETADSATGPWAVELLAPPDAITLTNASASGNSTLESLAFGTRNSVSDRAQFTLSSSALSVSSDVVVGRTGLAALRVESGTAISRGFLTSGTGVVGDLAGSDGTAHVTGTNPQGGSTEWGVSNSLTVGKAGTGALTVDGLAKVTSNSGVVGEAAGSNGTITIREGATAPFGSKSRWDISAGLSVGVGGTGQLNIESGAQVTNLNGVVGQNAGGIGSVVLKGSAASGISVWDNAGTLVVAESGSGTIEVQDGAALRDQGSTVGKNAGSNGVITVTGTDSGGNRSSWTSNGSAILGENGSGSLIVSAGGSARLPITGSTVLGQGSTGSGSALVSGAGSLLIASDLTVGGAGTGILTVENGGEAMITGTTTVGPNGTVNLNGGQLSFGTADPTEFERFNVQSGTLIGEVPTSGLIDIAALPPVLRAGSPADLSGVTLRNSGRLVGNGNLAISLDNLSGGEVEVITGERMQFGGSTNANGGQITLAGGQVDFATGFTNLSNSLVLGNGSLRTGTSTTNGGTMAFSATANIIGDVNNSASGLITSSGDTTFFDDVVNSGTIRTNAGSSTVYFGSYSGNGDTGTGTVIMEGDLKPGSSPGIMAFAGDLVFGDTADTEIELGGLVPGTEFDQITVADQLTLNGDLEVSLFGGFTPSIGDLFPIITAAGGLTGTFDSAQFPTLSGGLGFETIYGPSSVDLLVVPLNGDFDADGDVDVADALAGQRIGASLDAWRTNFGTVPSPTSGVTAVPEPGAVILLLFGAALLPHGSRGSR
ncbi:MAG: hypothetical protein AAGA92_12005 [Planctomycetota bacterium]